MQRQDAKLSAQLWLKENEGATKAYNSRIERNGLFREDSFGVWENNPKVKSVKKFIKNVRASRH